MNQNEGSFRERLSTLKNLFDSRYFSLRGRTHPYELIYRKSISNNVEIGIGYSYFGFFAVPQHAIAIFFNRTNPDLNSRKSIVAFQYGTRNPGDNPDSILLYGNGVVAKEISTWPEIMIAMSNTYRQLNDMIRGDVRQRIEDLYLDLI